MGRKGGSGQLVLTRKSDADSRALTRPRTRKSWLVRNLAPLFTGLALLVPLATSSVARADRSEKALAEIKVERIEPFQIVDLSVGVKPDIYTVYPSELPSGKPTKIKVKGPAKIQLEFFAVVDQAAPLNDTNDLDITYKVDNEIIVEKGNMRTASKLQAESELGKKFLEGKKIAGGVSIMIPIPEGEHSVSVISPFGLVTVLEYTSFAQPPQAEAPEAATAPVQRTEPVVEEAPTPVVKEVPKPEDRINLAVGLEAMRLTFAELNDNKGDLDGIAAYVRTYLGKGFGTYTGLRYRSGGTRLTLKPESAVRIHSGDVILGATYGNSGHGILLAFTIGGQRIQGSSEGQDTNSRTSEILGGRFQYDYWYYLRVSAELSTDPLGPGVFFVQGTLPWGWVKNQKPSLSATVYWLHTLKALEIGGPVVSRLDPDLALWQILAAVPLFKIIDPLAIGLDVGVEAKNTSYSGFMVGPRAYLGHKGFSGQVGGLMVIPAHPMSADDIRYMLTLQFGAQSLLH
ncbi:hypothetical protein HY988_02735 [Candidatus Micrarchaeota archaeon]|nr:hypothetical protein [Candidatus Micrarchaeota archaeon]